MSCMTRTARLGSGIRSSAASTSARACLLWSASSGPGASVADLDDAERDLAAALPFVGRRDPKGDSEQERPQRAGGIVVGPAPAKGQEDLLRQIVHLRRRRAEAPQRSIDVVELVLERLQARLVGGRLWSRRGNEAQMTHDHPILDCPRGVRSCHKDH